MTNINTYYINSATSATFLDFELQYGNLSLIGTAITLIGTRRADAVYVTPGISFDFTAAGAGVDTVYLKGNYADYSIVTTAETITFSRGTGANAEVVRMSALPGVSADNVIFKDGSAASSVIAAAVNSSSVLALNTAQTSEVLNIPAPGITEVTAYAESGASTFTGFKNVSLLIIGSRGVDKVYVKEGSIVNATALGASSDIIYMRGRWSDYTKTFTNETMTFTRTTASGDEKIIVGAMAGSGDDQLVFFDGAVSSLQARLAYVGNASVALENISGYNPNLKTPGVDVDPPVIAIGSIWGDNIFSLPEKVQSASAGSHAITGTFGSGAGSVEDGQVVTLNIDGHVYTGTASNNAWSVVVPDTIWSSLSHGNQYTVTASVKDLAGNASNVASAQFTVSLATPDVPTVQVLKTTNTAPQLSGLAKKVISSDRAGSSNESDYITLGNGDSITVEILKKNVDSSYTLIANGTHTYTVGGGSNPNGFTYNGTTGAWSYSVANGTLESGSASYEVRVTTKVPGYADVVSIGKDNLVIDLTGPQVVSVTDNLPGHVINSTGNVDYTFTFDELAHGLKASSFTAINGAVTNVTQGAGTTWIVTVAPQVSPAVNNGLISLTLKANEVQDALGNRNTVFETHDQVINNVTPSLTLNPISGDNVIGAGDADTQVISGTCAQGASIVITVGGQSHAASVVGTNWSKTLNTADLIALGNGQKTISVTATDTAGNTAELSSSFTVDTVVPTITVTSDSANLHIGGEARLTFLLSKPSINFAESDITVTHGTLSHFTGSGTVYTAIFTPDTSYTGVASVSVAANAFTDVSGNHNIAIASPLQITVDTLAPQYTALNPAVNGGIAPNGDFIMSFAETVQGVAGKMIYIRHATTNTIVESIDAGSSKVTITHSGNGSTVTINPNATLESNSGYYVQIQAGAFSDAVGNLFAGISDSTTWAVTTSNLSLRAETISVDHWVNQAELAAPITIKLSASSVMNGVLAALSKEDFRGTITSSDGTHVITINGSQGVYDPNTGEWTASIAANTLNAGTIYNFAGVVTGAAGIANGLSASTGAPETFSVDTAVTAPTVSITTDSGSSNTDGITNSKVFTVSGLEIANATAGISGVEKTEYQIDGTSGAWTTLAATDTSFTLGATSDGTHTVYVREIDHAGNTVTSSKTFTLDTTVAAATLALATDSGSSNTDGITNSKVFTVSGLEVANATAGISGVEKTEYQLDGTSGAWTTLAATDTSFTLGATTDGTHTVYVREIDHAGNTSTISSKAFSLDTTVAAATLALATDSGSSNTDGITNSKVFTVSGLEVANATAGISGVEKTEYQLDGTSGAWTTLAATDTSFTLGATTDGTHTVYVREIDHAGNTSTISSKAFSLDTTVAAATLALATDSGSSNTDGITNSKVFTVSGLEVANATAGISGVEKTEYQIDGTSGAWTTLAATDTSFTLGATSDGTHTVYVREIDHAGNTSTISSKAFSLDTTVAAATLALATDSGSSNTDGITNSKVFTVSGLEVANATAGISGVEKTEYQIDGTSGAWTTLAATDTSFTLGATTDGTHTVYVREIDHAGNTSTISSKAFSLDTTVAAATLALATDSGSSNTDGITNSKVFTVSGLEIANATAGISGVEKTEYQLDGTSGAWTTLAATDTSFTLGATTDGTHTVYVREIDHAGNTSTISSKAFSLDTTVAAATLALATDSGSSNTDGITNSKVFTVSGLEIANATAGISGVEKTEYQIDGTSGAWTTLAATDTSFTLGATTDGTHTVYVREIDHAGNTVTSSKTFTLDTTVAAATLALATDSGSSNTDGITNSKVFTVSGLEVANATAGISGVEKTEYQIDGTSGAWTTLAATDTSFTLGATTDGTHTVYVREIDHAGNTVTSSKAFSLDTTVAAATLALATDSGSSNTDGITNSKVFTVSGLEVANATAGISGVEKTEYQIDGTSGAWTTLAATDTSFTLGATTDGTHTVYVREIDHAGNTVTSSKAFSLDTTVAAATLALATDSGSSNTDGITNSKVFTVSGLEVANATAGVSGFARWEWQLDSSTGTWSTDAPDAGIADGTHTVYVREIDHAGNTSTISSKAFSLDTTVAAATLALATDSGSSNTDGITNSKVFTVSGLEVANATAGISGVEKTEYQLDGTSGAWTTLAATDTSFTLGATTDGTHTVYVREIDHAGNTSTISSKAFSLDTTVAAATLALATDSGSSNTDGITNSKVFTVSGLEIANATAGISGVEKTEYQIDGTSGAWTTLAATDTSFTLGATTDGTHTVYVREIDHAGNTVTSSKTFTLDTTVAAATLALATDSGSSNTDGITNSKVFTVSGLEVANATAGISGVEKTEYQIDGTSGAWTTLAATDTSFTLGATTDGTHTVYVREIDHAGNTVTSSKAFSLDTTVAAATLALATDSGSSNTDGITNSKVFTVSGLEIANATAGISGVEKTEYQIDGTSGAWTTLAATDTSFTLGATTDGTHTVYVREIDHAGNTVTSSKTFTLDTTVAAATLALATDSGSSNTDGITNSKVFTVSGLEVANATAGISGVEKTEYQIDGTSGAWTTLAATDTSFTLGAVADGTHTVYVREIDHAGNTVTSSKAFSLDTFAPSLQSIESDISYLVAGSVAHLKFTFNEDVIGFTASDIGFSNSPLVAISNFAGSGHYYTADLTPVASTSATTFSLIVDSGAYQDLAGNINTAKAINNFGISTAPVTASMTSDKTFLNAITNKANILIELSDSPGTNDFNVSDITVLGAGVISAFTKINDGTNRHYSAVLTAPPDSDGSIDLSIGAGAFNNAGGVNNIVTSGLHITVDTKPPTNTFNAAIYQSVDHTLTLMGSGFSSMLGSGDASGVTDIKSRLDWSKLSYDIDHNSTSTDIGFTLTDISSAIVNVDLGIMVIKLTSTKAASLEASAGFGGVTLDSVDIGAGFTRDLAGNASTTDGVSDATAPTSLSVGYQGTLSSPTYVDGGSLYYFWSPGDAPMKSLSQVNPIFNLDAHGQKNPGGDITTETYRYAYYDFKTLTFDNLNPADSILLGLPLLGYSGGGSGNLPSTPVQGNEVNPTYDGMMAVWDSANGTGSGQGGISGVPSGWGSGRYLTATATAKGTGALMTMNYGWYMYGAGDGNSSYVALQVI